MHDPIAHKFVEDRFTKSSDALKYIKELELLDLSSISDDELEKIIDKYFPFFVYTNATIPKGEEVFRARIKSNNKRFTSVQDIYVRPASEITTYGRTHKPNERIFYCASNYLLAAFEVIQDLKYGINPANAPAFVTVGIWKLKEDLRVTNIIYSPILHSLRSDIAEKFQDYQNVLNNGILKGYLKEDTATANNLIGQFFADQFTKTNIKSHHDYKISALYSRRLKLLNSFLAPKFYSERFEGINYPSVAMNYKGDNQAFFIESVEEKLEIVNAIEIVCGNINFETGEFTHGVLHEAESIKDGIITWKEEIYRPKESSD